MDQKTEELQDLRQLVERQMQEYVCGVSTGSIGNPWTAEKIEASLQAMRNALVDPIWAEVEMRETFEQIQLGEPTVRRCAVVADNLEGTFLLWDPIEHDFLLAARSGRNLSSFGVRGDAVGCFLAI